MFEKLLKQWANEQGFQTWSQDHAAVLRNLAKWLNSNAVEQSVHLTAFGVFITGVLVGQMIMFLVSALAFGGR